MALDIGTLRGYSSLKQGLAMSVETDQKTLWMDLARGGSFFCAEVCGVRGTVISRLE